MLVTERALGGLRAGSVVVDLAAGPLGGNVAGSTPDTAVTAGNGVTVIGAGNLASGVPVAASTAYSRNVTALLGTLVRDGALVVDPDDEVQGALLVTYEGAVVDRTASRGGAAWTLTC